jgi:hypothetical protein
MRMFMKENRWWDDKKRDGDIIWLMMVIIIKLVIEYKIE